MCGICGIIGNLGKDESSILLKKMMDDQIHRGPNDEGFVFLESASLGFRRLIIVGGEEGRQPIFNEARTIAFICNGEIYNYRQLRKELEQKSHVFSTTSDTEVVLHLYEEYGQNAWQYLKGDFAFALADEENKKVFLVRDRIGVKPLYIRRLGGQFYFSSEIKPLLSLASTKPSIHRDAIRDFFRYRFICNPLTPFSGILKVPPGTEVCFEYGSARIRRYWHLSTNQFVEQDWTAVLTKLDELLTSSVQGQGLNEVPTGIVLSGGLDSNILLSMLSQISSQPIYTYTVDFDRKWNRAGVSEFELALESSLTFGSSHTRVAVTPQSFAEAIKDTILSIEEPIGDAAAPLLHLISQRAREDVRVLLSGDGADEIFAGYPLYRQFLSTPEQHGMARRIFSRDIESEVLDEMYRKEASKKDYSPWADIGIASDQGMYADDTDLAINEYNQDAILNILLRNDVRFWLSDDLLLKTDKIHMGSSIEGRVPFLDHELVNFAFNLRSKYKIDEKSEKIALRKYAQKKNLLPSKYIFRKKTGFSFPIQEWFSGPLQGFIKNLLLDSCLIEFGVVKKDKYRSHISDFLRSGNTLSLSDSHTLWSLIALEQWFRLFVMG